MKLKNIEIVAFENVVSELLNKNIPLALSTALDLNIEILASPAKVYEKNRISILEKYAEKGEDGNYKVKDGDYVIIDRKNYNQELQDLLGITVDVAIQTVSYNMVKLCDEKDKYDAVTGAQYRAIKFMIMPGEND